VPWFALKAILYLVVDRFDRSLFNRLFYRNYRGRPVSSGPEMAQTCFEGYFKPRIRPDAVECVHRLRDAGFRIVLVTGSLDFLIAPLARHLGINDVIAAELVSESGRFTGALAGKPVCDQEKATLVRQFADANGIALEESHAYGDSIADLAMLESVGHPHAVNPDRRLRSTAQSRSWPVLAWL
jgi:HAD superfamily hydrolase (TIGR01490 family)